MTIVKLGNLAVMTNRIPISTTLVIHGQKPLVLLKKNCLNKIRESISDLEIAKDFSSLKYSDGLEHRGRYPYPNSNDTTYPQEKLKGSRNIKLKLSELFPEEFKLPSLI